MRLLADENVPLQAIEAMRRTGHDVLWVRTDLPGTADAALLDFAESHNRILLTLDKDFWQIAMQRREPLVESGVILFRVHPATAENLTPLMLRTLAIEQDWRGHASVATMERLLMVEQRPHTR